MKTYQAILFDLDATLVDNAASFQKAYQLLSCKYPSVFEKENQSLATSVIRLYHIGLERREEAYFKLCREIGWKQPISFPDFWSEWMELYLQSTLPFEWTHSVLKALKEEGYSLGMITNGKIEFQNSKIEAAKLSNYFDCILISEAVGLKKPDPRIFRLGAEKLNCKIEDCLFVGDNPDVDIAGAIHASMDCLLVGEAMDTYGATYHAKDTQFLLNMKKSLYFT